MFDSVNALSAQLPRPAWTGDPTNDRLAVEQYLANGRRLRNEAFACLGRASMASLRAGWRRVTEPLAASPSHQT